MVHIGNWGRPVGRNRFARSIGFLATLLLAGLALVPAGASAEPLCANTWIGPSEGSWEVAKDWSTGALPTSTEVVCIGTGDTVNVTEGTASVLEVKGTVVIPSGKLEVASALEASSVASLTVSGGILKGAGTVDVSGSMSWSAGELTGSGSTVILPGVSAMLEGSEHRYLVNHLFINEGTMTLSGGHLSLVEGAELKNAGIFKINSESFPAIGFEGSGTLQNTGTFERTEGTGTARVEPKFENLGTVIAKSGSLGFSEGGSGSGTNEWRGSEGKAIDFESGSFSLSTGTLLGPINVEGSTVSMGNVNGKEAQVSIASPGGELSITSGSTATVGSFVMGGGTLSGAGTLDISGSLLWSGESTMSGPGSTVLLPGVSGTLATNVHRHVSGGRSFVNEGTITLSAGHFALAEGSKLKNLGTFNVNSESSPAIGFEGANTLFQNLGIFERTEGKEVATIEPNFENLGRIEEATGKFSFSHPVYLAPETRYGGSKKPSSDPGQQYACAGEPVSCATGNLIETQTDFSIGGRGVGLELTRTYNSQAAAAGEHGAFGYGWTSSFNDHLVVEKANKKATLYQAEGSAVPFTEESGGSFAAPAWSQDILNGTEAGGYTLTLADQTKYKFAGSSGRLESVTDRNGNATTLAYNAEGHLETITDPVSRKIKLKYNSEGFVESAEDPMGHVVKYTYESGNLKSVTQPAESSLRWQFKYDGSHEITEMTDGRGGKTTNEYNGSHQVIKQTDPNEHTLTFEYESFLTKITNKSTGSVTLERFTSNDEPYLMTRGFGTESATTETFTYNAAGQVLAATNGDGYTTSYGYDSAGDRTSMTDPDNDETKWTYDSSHDVETMTTPKGETTTIKREAHGNPEVIERPAPGSKTQTTKYKYTAHGEVESVTNPLEHTWKYEYDAKGDKTAEIDPEGNKRTWEYNEDSQAIASVSPRGNVAGGKPTEFTTKIERDAQGRPLTITDPLKHTTKYKYDGDGNVEKVTDGNGHTTTYTYNADNQVTKVEAPNKSVTETEYDGAGQVTVQTDGNKHKTKYKRNIIEEVTEVTNPLRRVTTKEYDGAGNLIKLTDPAKRTTTYTYDHAGRLTEVSYSSGKPSTIKYEYDKDGNRTKMTDGTGTTTYTYDQLDRLTESENGHKEVVKYEYDLANDQTKITYPNGKEVTHVFDKDGRLEKLADWLKHETKFTYNPDSDLEKTVFPSETKDEDKYTYNDADQMTEVKMVKSTETLASLVYTLDSDGQVKKTTTKGLPGAEVTEDTYDENNRLTKYGTTEYKYDAANNPTKEGSTENTFNEGDELEKSTSATYSYDELGERTKTKPSTGPATTYGYDQAGELTSVEQPKEGATPEIKDSYEYNGEGLRTAQTINGTTSYLAWDMAEELPLILSDGTNSYIYGPGGVPLEQINSSETPTYLHHDQQGSTRLLTGSAGTVSGKCTYGGYGAATCEGTATTPLGYDGQYTSADTGLIYMRARTYDPTTGEFLSADPLLATTHEPYAYAGDNPLNFNDPTGLIFGLPSPGQIAGAAVEGVESAAKATVNAVEDAATGVVNAVNTAGKAIANVGQYAAPAFDVAAGVACGVAIEACGAAIVINFGFQELLAGIQVVYNPNYNLALNEAIIFAGAGLGSVAAGAAEFAAEAPEDLGLVGQTLLGAVVSLPGDILDAAELAAPGGAAISCQ
jgi:RHS repeat-associated protein